MSPAPRHLLHLMFKTLPWLAAVFLLGWGSDALAAQHWALAAAPAADDVSFNTQMRTLFNDHAIETGGRIVLAILIFIGGWIVAKLLAYGVYQVLTRTRFDNILAEKLGINMLLRERKGSEEDAVERFAAQVVFWLVMLLVIVGVLEFAGLEQMGAPIAGFVSQIVGALPQIAKAVIILLVAYVAARILKLAITGLLDRTGVDQRVAEMSEEGAKTQVPFSETIGRVVFWLVMLVGIAGAFEALRIGAIANPLHNAIDSIVEMLPRIGLAVLLVLLGWVGGRIARVVVRRVLQSIGFDGLVTRAQLDRVTGTHSPSDVVGIVVMVFIVLHAVIAALNTVGLETLSVPLTGMIAQFWNILPALAVSVLIIVAGVLIGRLLRRVVSTPLRNLGLDRFMERLGFKPLPGRDERLNDYSELVGYAVQVAVILVAVAQALANLGLLTWATYVNAFLEYVVTNVAVAVVVVLLGFAIGNYVRDLIAARNDDETGRWIAEFARYAVLVFAFTAAVRQLDVAEDFVLLTFGLLFGALCLGAALAFGLGGREVANDILKRRYDDARTKIGGMGGRGGPSRPSTPTKPSVPGAPPMGKPPGSD